MHTAELAKTLGTLFSELLDGAPASGAYMLNAGDEGLLRSLDKLSAEAASALTPTGSSIAAQIDRATRGPAEVSRRLCHSVACS